MPGTKRKFSICGICNRVDYKNMVQCDDCDGWYHYLCVGVGPEISKCDWSCMTCRSEKILNFTSATENSVSKPEIKITERDIETIPEIWIEKINAQYYLYYPLVSSNEEFLNHVCELKKPSPGWKKVKCQLLLSRLKTYQLAKSSEDSIARNLKRRKTTLVNCGTTSTANKSKNIPPVVKENQFYTKEEVDELIQKGIRDALANNFQNIGSGVDVNNSTYTVVNEPKTNEMNLEEATVPKVTVLEGTLQEATVHEETVQEATIQEATIQEATIQEATIQEATIQEATVQEATVAEGYEVDVNNCTYTVVNEPGTNELNLDEAIVQEANVHEARVQELAEEMAEMEIKFPIDSPVPLNEFNFTKLSNNYMFYEDKFSKKGAQKLSSTMIIVSNQVIKDSYLKKFSYMGKPRNGKKKDAFNIYENVEKLIVSATMKAYNNYNGNDENFVQATKEEVSLHYRSQHIRFAEQRANRKNE